MLGTVLLIVLVLFLLGGLAPIGGAAAPGGWYRGYGYGPGIGGILGVLLVVVLVLVLLGHF